MLGCPVELPTSELEDLPAVKGRQDILGVADLLAETQRTLEYPFKLGRCKTLGSNQRREKRQAEPVFDPRALGGIVDELRSAQPRSKCEIAARFDESRAARSPAFSQ